MCVKRNPQTYLRKNKTVWSAKDICHAGISLQSSVEGYKSYLISNFSVTPSLLSQTYLCSTSLYSLFPALSTPLTIRYYFSLCATLCALLGLMVTNGSLKSTQPSIGYVTDISQVFEFKKQNI